MAIDDPSVDRLLDATGGHPQDTMQVCAALYYLMRDTGARTVGPELLEVAYEQAMRELERPFAPHWSELGSHKYLQQVAKRIAHRAVLYAADAEGGPVPRPEVLRALAGLGDRGLVVRLGRGRYDFVEPMFGEYVRRLDEASLRDPERIDVLARRMGLAMPQVGQVQSLNSANGDAGNGVVARASEFAVVTVAQ